MLCAAALWPQKAFGGATESSYRQARTLIDQSIDQMEVGEWLLRPTPLLIEVEGQLDAGAEHQGVRSDAPDPWPYRETWAWDPQTGIAGREYRQIHTDGRIEWKREIFSAQGELWEFDLSSGSTHRSAGPGVVERRVRLHRRFPPVLLAEALGHASALRFTGRFGPFDTVQMQTSEQQSLSLFFGRESHHLSSVEYLTDLPTFGDSTVSWKFGDYRPVPGIGEIPHHISVHLNDAPFTDVSITRITRDHDQVRSFLDVESLPHEVAAPREPRFESLGEGVHRIADLVPGKHLLVVEFDQYLMLMDAPAARPLLHELPASMVSHTMGKSAISITALRMLQEAIPDKPVKYVLISHFHSDSAGGLLAFSGVEVDILASREQISDIADFLGRSHTLCELEAHTENLHLKPVHQKLVIEDAQQRVEILQVGKNPHSESMLVAWLPHSGILWASDLQRDVAGKPDPNQGRLNRFFKQWLGRQAFQPKNILTTQGDGLISPDALFRVDSEQTLNLPRDP